MVGDVRFAGERDGNDLLRLIVIERLKDETVKVFDIFGSACRIAGGLSGTFGQGVSWRTVARRNGVPLERAEAFGDTSWGLARGLRLRTKDRAAGEGK
jgi:hypothetical protein